MAAFFTIGEKKTRPGVYYRYENSGTPPTAGADDGKCAAVFRSNWGPVGEVKEIEDSGDIAKIYGDGGASGTTDVALEEFKGGARKVFAIRLGSGSGTKGSYDIKAPADPKAEGWYIHSTNSYSLSNDTAIASGTTYYTLDVAKATPEAGDNPSSKGWYELSGTTYTVSSDATVEDGKDYYTVAATAVTATTATVITMNMKYPGSRAFTVTIRPTVADTTVSELIIYEGTDELETLTFSNATDSVNALMAAFAEQGSDFFTLTKVADNSNKLSTVSQAAITPGTDPTVNSAAYSAAFELLEAYRWNVLAIDTEDAAIHAVMQLYLARIYQNGKFTMGVVGEPTTVAIATRMSHATAFNSYQMIYVGHGFIGSDGKTYEGYRAAARIAGLVAGTPSNESTTHITITGAVDVSEVLTNSQYESAIKAGMLTFSKSAAGAVWVEQGINTLVTPGTKEDEGWKKIKRTKVRFELFQRLNDSVEGLVGRINNDPDGRMTIVQVGNSVCNSMMAEKKLLPGAYVEVDSNNAPAGDSAWFIVHADDIDALEKMYFTFKFRFAPEE